MKFIIAIQHAGYTYRYTVNHQVIDQRTEHFTLVAKNKTLLISSNRPYYLSHPGLKKRQPILKLKQGVVWNTAFLEKIFDAIAGYFDRLPTHKLVVENNQAPNKNDK